MTLVDFVDSAVSLVKNDSSQQTTNKLFDNVVIGLGKYNSYKLKKYKSLSLENKVLTKVLMDSNDIGFVFHINTNRKELASSLYTLTRAENFERAASVIANKIKMLLYKKYISGQFLQ